MTSAPVSLMDPLPLFHHIESGRVFYITAGPCPLVFAISLQDVSRNAPVTDRGTAAGKTTHPFGHATEAASLSASVTRRELAEATILRPSPLDTRLSSWATFCDEVADRLTDGEPLDQVLRQTWVFDDGQDVALDDDQPTVLVRNSR